MKVSGQYGYITCLASSWDAFGVQMAYANATMLHCQFAILVLNLRCCNQGSIQLTPPEHTTVSHLAPGLLFSLQQTWIIPHNRSRWPHSIPLGFLLGQRAGTARLIREALGKWMSSTAGEERSIIIPQRSPNRPDISNPPQMFSVIR